MQTFKFYLGEFCALMFPKKRQLVLDNFTLPYWGRDLRMDTIDRLIRFYFARKLGQSSNPQLEDVHRSFWRKQEKSGWYRATRDRIDQFYLPHYGPYVDQVAERAHELHIKRLVEFGTGNGSWLNVLKERIPGIREFIGVDLAASQIDENRQRYPDLQFVCQDMLAWVKANAQSHSLFHTNSGVFEYLCEKSLRELLATLHAHSPNSLLFLIEPVHRDFDPLRETHSRALGRELTYSHNYPLLLRETGFEILQHDVVEFENYYMQVLQVRS